MDKLKRHERILRLASERGILHLATAQRETGASPATLRRDFGELVESGTVQRFHGGIRVVRRGGELPFTLREVQCSSAKSSIARKAAGFLRAGDVLFIDGGTTTYHLCLCLPSLPLRIVTNSLRVSAYLDLVGHREPDWEIYLTGGRMQSGSNMLTGPGAVHTLDFYHADWAFLSVGGLTADGLYNTSEAIVETERKMIERADHVIILADQSKLGKRAMCRVCAVDAIDQLITDRPKGRSLVEEELQAAGCRIVHA